MFLILSLITEITDSVTCFSLKTCAFTCLNLLNSSSENCDDDREGWDYDNNWLIFFQIFSFTDTWSFRYSYSSK